MLTLKELAEIVSLSGENDYHDAKGPMSWRDKEEAAKLSKCIVSFANSESGGAIVIGKSELSDKRFRIDGLNLEQLETFDTTTVANFVNSHFDPPVSLTCHRVEFEGKQVVVIEVNEFSDIPIICSKQFDGANPNKPILRRGAIYVRDENAQSTEILRSSSLRQLIGISRRKGTGDILTAIKSILMGYAVNQPASPIDQFCDQYNAIESDIKSSATDDSIFSQGNWRFSLHPESFKSRWNHVRELQQIIEKSSIRNGLRTYPSTSRISPFDWGIKGSSYTNSWAFSAEGLFYLIEFWNEDRQEYKSPWLDSDGGKSTLPAGKWVEYQETMTRVISFFKFAGNLSNAYPPQETLTIKAVASNLRGRKLASVNYLYDLDEEYARPCEADKFTFEKNVSAGRLVAEWGDLCVDCLSRFLHFFPSLDLPEDTIRKWINVS